MINIISVFYGTCLNSLCFAISAIGILPALKAFNDRIISPAVPIVLISAGIYYAFRLKFFHIFHPVILTKSVFGKYAGDKRSEKEKSTLTKKAEKKKKGISPVRSLLLALAGTLGVGNIVGVAGAISAGGFGSIFWMWVSAVAAMLLKYAEVVLAHRHRIFDASGNPHGSAMLYIKDFFARLRLMKLGKAVAMIFAVMCIIDSVTMGCVVQVNAVSHALEGEFSVPCIVSGTLISIITAVIFIRGGQAVSKVTEIVVPLMSAIYILLSLLVIPVSGAGGSGFISAADAFSLIFKDAFSFRSIGGGVFGFITSRALRLGTIRGILSNEAGCGTAPIAHSESTGESPAAQGILGIVEVFIDTIVLCTMTAIVLIIGYDRVSMLSDDPVMMVIGAYSAILGQWSGILLGISVLFFGFATIICWAHYGSECMGYISGSRAAGNAYRFIYCSALVVGACTAPEYIWLASDLSLGIMTLINVPVLCFMSGEVKNETDIYF